MMTGLLAFFGVSALVICTPGPDTALTVRNSIVGGRRAGVFTAAGIAAGQLVWTVAASLGIAGLLQASQPAFTALKIAGAAYLIFLGVQSILGAIRGRHSKPERRVGLPELAPRRAMRQGFISNLANPKMAAFFSQLASPVRAGRIWPRCCTPSTRFGVLPHDIRLAIALRRRPQQSGTIPATVTGASHPRRGDGDCSGRLRSPTRDRNPLVLRGIMAGPRGVCHLENL